MEDPVAVEAAVIETVVEEVAVAVAADLKERVAAEIEAALKSVPNREMIVQNLPEKAEEEMKSLKTQEPVVNAVAEVKNCLKLIFVKL